MLIKLYTWCYRERISCMPGNRAETWERLIWGGSLKEGIKINQVNPKWRLGIGTTLWKVCFLFSSTTEKHTRQFSENINNFSNKKLSLAKLRHVLRRKKEQKWTRLTLNEKYEPESWNWENREDIYS